jgi:structure-specific recognition protein 1
MGQVSGTSLVTFPEVLCLLPRGRFDMELYTTFMRLRGKTYDYKIPYMNVKRMFMLPRPDDVHSLFAIGLDPPIRQGQTRYPWLVFQLVREDWFEATIHATTESLEDFAGRLKSTYDEALVDAMSNIFYGVTNKHVITPGTFTNAASRYGLKCSLKANEGFLYPTEHHLVFLPKPPTVIAYTDIALVTLSRTDNTRTFDAKVALRSGNEVHLSSMNREENQPLGDFLRQKGVRVLREQAEVKATVYPESDMDASSSEEEGGKRREVVRRDDDDESSPDEDFAPGSDSDVSLEYHSEEEEEEKGEEE